MEHERLEGAAQRQRMIDSQLRARGINDERLLGAMSLVERERFVDERHRKDCYSDGPLPIGFGQTISQPYVVAYMCQTLEIEAQHRVLEVGFGSGYVIALLSRLVERVVGVERLEPLYRRALVALSPEIASGSVHLYWGDGARGISEWAPYDRILVSAAIKEPDPPRALLEQLKMGGAMIAPMGAVHQSLCHYIKEEDGMVKQSGIPVSFVPFVNDDQ